MLTDFQNSFTHPLSSKSTAMLIKLHLLLFIVIPLFRYFNVFISKFWFSFSCFFLHDFIMWINTYIEQSAILQTVC